MVSKFRRSFKGTVAGSLRRMDPDESIKEISTDAGLLIPALISGHG